MGKEDELLTEKMENIAMTGKHDQIRAMGPAELSTFNYE